MDLVLPPMPAPWVAQYIGIPFVDHGRSVQATDCWGLARMVLERQARITRLPDFTTDYSTVKDRRLPDVFAEEMRHWSRVNAPQLFDVAVLRIGGRPRHVGVMVARGQMLTIDRSTASCIERLDGPRWAGRLEGYFRGRA